MFKVFEEKEISEHLAKLTSFAPLEETRAVARKIPTLVICPGYKELETSVENLSQLRRARCSFHVTPASESEQYAALINNVYNKQKSTK